MNRFNDGRKPVPDEHNMRRRSVKCEENLNIIPFRNLLSNNSPKDTGLKLQQFKILNDQTKTSTDHIRTLNEHNRKLLAISNVWLICDFWERKSILTSCLGGGNVSCWGTNRAFCMPFCSGRVCQANTVIQHNNKIKCSMIIANNCTILHSNTPWARSLLLNNNLLMYTFASMPLLIRDHRQPPRDQFTTDWNTATLLLPQ